MRHERFPVTRSMHDRLKRPDASEAFAELAGLKATLMKKVEVRRQKDTSRLSESIRRVIMDVALAGPTGTLARNLLAKHATQTGLAA